MKAGAAILEVFHRAAGQFVGVDELRRSVADASASAGLQLKLQLQEELAELQELGYTIESHPHFGYRLLASPDRLTADEIKARLKADVIGSEILVFDETASTNDTVELLAKSGAREGLVVFAESQTKGRGRHGRAWTSPRGKGLWFSVLLRPELPPAATSRITVAASVAVARAIRQSCGVEARIKWPNDVILNGKKLAGILVETKSRIASHETGPGDYLVLGIGIDVNCAAEDFPPEIGRIATSLQIETGHPQDRLALAARVLAALDECYAVALTDFELIVDEWAHLCTTLGKQIIVTMGRRRIEGFAQALDGDGALLLRMDSGHTERILSGDLAVERA